MSGVVKVQTFRSSALLGAGRSPLCRSLRTRQAPRKHLRLYGADISPLSTLFSKTQNPWLPFHSGRTPSKALRRSWRSFSFSRGAGLGLFR